MKTMLACLLLFGLLNHSMFAADPKIEVSEENRPLTQREILELYHQRYPTNQYALPGQPRLNLKASPITQKGVKPYDPKAAKTPNADDEFKPLPRGEIRLPAGPDITGTNIVMHFKVLTEDDRSKQKAVYLEMVQWMTNTTVRVKMPQVEAALSEIQMRPDIQQKIQDLHRLVQELMRKEHPEEYEVFRQLSTYRQQTREMHPTSPVRSDLLY